MRGRSMAPTGLAGKVSLGSRTGRSGEHYSLRLLVTGSIIGATRFEVKIFVDTDADLHVFRRVRRDMESRGRTLTQVDEPYHRTVRPMHLEFVRADQRWADILIREGGNNESRPRPGHHEAPLRRRHRAPLER